MKFITTHDPKKTSVALIMGGWNAERDVSLASGESIQTSLLRQGYSLRAFDLKKGTIPDLVAFLNKPKPDIIFNALHGIHFEDGCIQGLFDLLEIPYTHSRTLASSIAMHKPTTKIFFEHLGIPCAKGMTIEGLDFENKLHFPYVLKPTDEGSSEGVHILHSDIDVAAVKSILSPSCEMMVEEYIPGQELSCAIANNTALGIVELRPREGFYDYKAKYTPNFTQHLVPAPLPQKVYDAIMDYTLKIHQFIGCRGVSRCDFRYDPLQNKLAALEVNTQPGFTSLSLVPEIAAYKGISFDDLTHWIIEDGLCQKTGY